MMSHHQYPGELLRHDPWPVVNLSVSSSEPESDGITISHLNLMDDYLNTLTWTPPPAEESLNLLFSTKRCRVPSNL